MSGTMSGYRGVVGVVPRLWLFHGTRESAAECITENEFQVRMAGSNRGTMFGPGIYLADSVSRARDSQETHKT